MDIAAEGSSPEAPHLQLRPMEAFIVDAGNKAAVSAMRKICSTGCQPGRVFFVTPEEFEAIQESVIRIPAVDAYVPKGDGG